MTAQMTIDQATLAAGQPGYSRDDGVAGQLVTVTATPTGSTYALYLRTLAPVGDTPPVVTQTSDRVWTFTPPSLAIGRTYRIELVVDEGRPTESRQTRVFSILTRNHGFAIPAPNEQSSPLASFQNMGADILGASERNAGGNVYGYARALHHLIQAVDALAGNTPMSHDVVGDTFEIAGGLFLEAGTYGPPRVLLSATANAAEVEFRRNSDGVVLATATRTGTTPGWVTAPSGFQFADLGNMGVDIYLRNSDAASTARIRGVQMRFTGGAPIVV